MIAFECVILFSGNGLVEFKESLQMQGWEVIAENDKLILKAPRKENGK